jgi:hypothetical protein
MYDAADLVGISHSSVDEWMTRSKSGEEPYAGFSRAVLHARAAVKAESIARVRSGRLINGELDWKASAFLLERQHPAEYGPQQVVAVKFEKELEAALDRLDAIKDKLGADAYNLVCAALAGERAPEEAGGAGGGSESR